MTCYQENRLRRVWQQPNYQFGRTGQGTQRYRCRNDACSTQTFLLDYRYKAYRLGVKRQVVEMAINGSGIRDTRRALRINKNTAIRT
jgi:transposase-like protein